VKEAFNPTISDNDKSYCEIILPKVTLTIAIITLLGVPGYLSRCQQVTAYSK
jgi:hypothetical protein